jgi:hypothetical protein
MKISLIVSNSIQNLKVIQLYLFFFSVYKQKYKYNVQLSQIEISRLNYTQKGSLYTSLKYTDVIAFCSWSKPGLYHTSFLSFQVIQCCYPRR